MTAKRKQELLLAAGIFMALCSIGFSFKGPDNTWFWQRYPWVPVLLLLFVFFAVKGWLSLELDRQKEAIRAEYSSQTGSTALSGMLSERETEIMGLVMQGLNNKEIADRLFIAHSTVKTHINNIYKILEVKNRREAIEKLNDKGQ